jgi:hypothetical protein
MEAKIRLKTMVKKLPMRGVLVVHLFRTLELWNCRICRLGDQGLGIEDGALWDLGEL